MTTIEIRDLEMDKELDRKAVASVFGGCPGGMGGSPVQTIDWPYAVMANPYDDSILYGRQPRIPSWVWGLFVPTPYKPITSGGWQVW